MNRFNLGILGLVLVAALGVIGCAQQPKSANSGDAVSTAAAMQTTEEKVKFLISEANAFVSSKKFEDAINTAQYVLANLDANSVDAKSILEKAKVELQKLAQAKIDEAKAGADKAISDVKGKLEGLGN